MLKKQSDRIQGFFFILVSAFMYASVPIVGKFAYASGLDAPTALIIRFGIAFVMLAAYLGFVKRETVIEPSPLILVQGCLLAVECLLYFYGIKYLPAGMTSVTFFTYPVFVTILAVVVFRERKFVKLFICILLALLGIGLISGIFGNESDLSSKGIILILSSSLCYAVYSILGQITLARSGPLSLTSTFVLVSFVVLCLAFPQKLTLLPHLTAQQWLIGAVLALVNTILAVFFFLKGVQKIGASSAGLISTVEPPFTLILASLILGESLSMIQFVGTVLIMTSILVTVYRPSSTEAG